MRLRRMIFITGQRRSARVRSVDRSKYCSRRGSKFGPSTHTGQLRTICNSSLRGSNPSCGLHRHRTHTSSKTHAHKMPCPFRSPGPLSYTSAQYSDKRLSGRHSHKLLLPHLLGPLWESPQLMPAFSKSLVNPWLPFLGFLFGKPCMVAVLWEHLPLKTTLSPA